MSDNGLATTLGLRSFWLDATTHLITSAQLDRVISRSLHKPSPTPDGDPSDNGLNKPPTSDNTAQRSIPTPTPTDPPPVSGGDDKPDTDNRRAAPRGQLPADVQCSLRQSPGRAASNKALFITAL